MASEPTQIKSFSTEKFVKLLPQIQNQQFQLSDIYSELVNIYCRQRDSFRKILLKSAK